VQDKTTGFIQTKMKLTVPLFKHGDTVCWFQANLSLPRYSLYSPSVSIVQAPCFLLFCTNLKDGFLIHTDLITNVSYSFINSLHKQSSFTQVSEKEITGFGSDNPTVTYHELLYLMVDFLLCFECNTGVSIFWVHPALEFMGSLDLVGTDVCHAEWTGKIRD
jgi:hypothetical protein